MAVWRKSSSILCLGVVSTFFVLKPSCALDPSKKLTQYAHTAWRLSDGVLPAAPTSIAQTRDGYIWIGTESGVTRFDGVRFVDWTPPSGTDLPAGNHSVFSILGAHDGGLWIGNRSGLAKILPNGSLRNFALSPAVTSSILEAPDGSAWITRPSARDSASRLCQISGSAVKCFGQADGLTTPVGLGLTRTAEGDLLVSGWGGVFRWNGTTKDILHPEGRQFGDIASQVQYIVEAPDRSLWVTAAGADSGLLHWANGSWSAVELPRINGIPPAVSSILLDRNGDLWIGTLSTGLFLLRHGQLEHFGVADGLSGAHVRNLMQDREGNVWVVTATGVDNFRNLPVWTYTSREGLSDDLVVSVTAGSSNNVWVATQDAIDNIAEHPAPSLHARLDFPGPNVESLLLDHLGRLWFGSHGDVYVRDGKNIRLVEAFHGSRNIAQFAEDAEGDIWVLSLGPDFGLERIHGGQVAQRFAQSELGMGLSLISDHAGTIWYSTQSGELLHRSGDQWEHHDLKKQGLKGLGNLYAADDGTVWGTSPQGVLAVRHGAMHTLTQTNGLPCAYATEVLTDAQGGLWVYSQCGIFALSRQEIDRWWANPASAVDVVRLGTADGVRPGAPMGRPPATRTTDGDLWFSNGSSLQRISPGVLQAKASPPPVLVESLLADGQQYPYSQHASIKALPRDIQIDYTALSFTHPQSIVFRYRLDGVDSDWRYVENRRSAFYTKLRPGSYRFSVQARQGNGDWSTSASTSFDVLPAWYQRTWFYLLCSLALAVGLWGLYTFRVRTISKHLAKLYDERLAERNRVARELHDTLMQTIQGSRIIVDQHRTAEDSVQRQEAIEQLSGWLRQAVAEGRAALQALRDPSAEGETIAAALRKTAAKVIENSGMTLNLRVVGSVRKLQPLIQEEICLIGAEAIRNAALHSNGTNIEIEIRYGRDFRLSVIDDGVGIPSEVAIQGILGHYGIQGMRERTQQLRGRLQIHAQTPRGTVVELLIPGPVIYRQNSRVGPHIIRRVRQMRPDHRLR